MDEITRLRAELAAARKDAERYRRIAEHYFVTPERTSAENMSKCQLKIEPFKQCCCNCRNHWKDWKGKWLCALPALMGESTIYINWPEHSIGCEMYSPIKK